MLQTILQTKITPPPRSARTLPRPRISNVLRQALDYRLSILQAEAGYGKSTALAEFGSELNALVWYQVHGEDNDPLVFLMHLCHAFLQVLPEMDTLPLTTLEAWDGTQGPLPWRSVVDACINALSAQLDEPLLLVLDDAHLVLDESEVVHIVDRLVSLAPAQLHILLSGRPSISLPSLSRLRAQGDVLQIEQSILNFTADEIAALFATHYALELSSDEVKAMVDTTEGWAIALQLIWQNIRGQASGSSQEGGLLVRRLADPEVDVIGTE